MTLLFSRRDFIAALGSAATIAATSSPGHARQQMPVIGFLNTASPGPFVNYVAGFHQGLKEGGFVEGQNVTVEYRWAEGRYERLPELAAELVRKPVSVLVTTGGDPAVRAALAATKTIPIVFASGNDPVADGYVASTNRPGGNATGTNQFTSVLAAKRIGLLTELVPAAGTVGVLVNPKFPATPQVLRDVRVAAAQTGISLVIIEATTADDFAPAFDQFSAKGVRALMIGSDPFFNSRRNELVALTAKHGLPAIYEFREFAVAGGLMSYGTKLADTYRQIGVYTGRILKGEKPADLPIVQSARFEFVINLKVAKEQGVNFPATLLASADEVIE